MTQEDDLPARGPGLGPARSKTRVLFFEELVDGDFDYDDLDEVLARSDARPAWEKDADHYPPHLKVALRLWRVRLEQLMLLLKPAQQAVLEEYFWRGRSQADIASRLGIRQQAVQQRLDTAVRELRRLLVENESLLRGIKLEEEL